MHRLILCLFVLLSACGGGGGGDSPPVTNTPPSTPPATTSSISGAVTAPNGAALSGVQLALSGAATSSTVANASGAYSFTGIANGNYVVTPSAAGAAFSPSSAAVTVQGQSVSAVNFARTPQSYASTQPIADAMAILHAQMLSDFAVYDREARNRASARGGMGGAYYLDSARGYVALVQRFVNDSLAFVNLRAQTMAIDSRAIAALFSTYATQDASFVDTFYCCIAGGLTGSDIAPFIADTQRSTNNIYALAILQLP